MKNLLSFFGALVISMCSLLGATKSPHPLVLLALGFGIWALFLYGYHKRSRKKAQRRYREQLFEDYLRSRPRR